MNRRHLFAPKIENGKFRVLLASDESQAVRRVNQQPVTSVATRQLITRDDLIFLRVYLGELVQPMHCDEDVLGDSVILRVACPAAEFDSGDALVGRSVNHIASLAVGAREIILLLLPRGGNPIGIVPRRYTRHNLQTAIDN